MLDVRRMMLLCELAELGTVTAVAARRNITSSAVSQQLRVLEDETGAVLFRRDGRTLGLTRSGILLVEHAQRVLGTIDEALSAVATAEAGTTRRLSLASFNMGIPLLAAPLVHRLRRETPDLQVQIHQHNRSAALRALRQGEIDLAIVCSYSFDCHESYSGLSATALIEEPLVLMAPPRIHPLIQQTGLSALADEEWITVTDAKAGLSVALLRAGERESFVPQVRHRLVGARNVCELAGTGVGPAIVPALSVPPGLRHFVVDGAVLEGRTISAVVRSGRQRDPVIDTALRTLTAIASQPRDGMLSAAS